MVEEKPGAIPQLQDEDVQGPIQHDELAAVHAKHAAKVADVRMKIAAARAASRVSPVQPPEDAGDQDIHAAEEK